MWWPTRWPLRLPLRFAYDAFGRVTSWTDINGSRYAYQYDGQNRCVAEGGAEGHLSLRVNYDRTDPATGLRVTTTNWPRSGPRWTRSWS
ncbi:MULTISPECIES: RHS repeat domain-containing protein [unclassified Streptomyces]|uniref:RHS repeat domain-containing protein n=1 Tax=unclassified Streptomyces TaxID=2593676 RepID=UPI000376BCE8|nr:MULTISPECIES: RHS repeat domain-containing protein [unclassified Streptomyces]MYT30111.1 hypothetical protein [Streptomyces sp. SID8354]